MGSEKLEALFVKRAICRPIIKQRSERRKESTLRRVCARGASVRNRTSPAGLGLGGRSGGGKREISCSHDKLEFAIFVLRSSRQRHVPGGHPPLPHFPIHPTYLPISDKLSFVLRIASVFYARGPGQRSTSPERCPPTIPPPSGFIGENLRIYLKPGYYSTEQTNKYTS